MRKLFLLMFVGLCSATAHAQIGTPKWRFQNRSQVERAVKANLQNLRAEYEIIMCARRVGMSQSVLKVYEQEVGMGPFSTHDKVAAGYAFAFWVDNSAIRWDWKADRGARICKTTQADAARITLYRERSYTVLPKSPEVILFEALYQNVAGPDLLANAKKRLQLLDRAIKIAPRWAELYYWRSMALQTYVGVLPSDKARPLLASYGQKALSAINKAAKLDPTFKTEGLPNKMSIYQMMEKPKEALDALDTYSRLRPSWASTTGISRRREYFLKEIRKSQ